MTLKKWRVPQNIIDILNDPNIPGEQGLTESLVINTVDAIQIATTDGLAPWVEFDPMDGALLTATNISTTESYVQTDGVKYYLGYARPFELPAMVDGQLQVGSSLVVVSGIDQGYTTDVRFAIGSYMIRVQISNYVYRAKYTPSGTLPFNFVEVTAEGGGSGSGSGGSGGSSGGGEGSGSGTSEVIATPTVTAGKVVATLAVNPTQTPVRAMINGVEQDLPEGSIVKHSNTQQKFIKIAGSATSFTAIEVSPKAEWEWGVSGAEAWAILQNA